MPVMSPPNGRFLDMCRAMPRTVPNSSTDYVSQSTTVHGHDGGFVDGGSFEASTDFDRRERQALLGIPQDADSLARLFTLSRFDRHLVAERLSHASQLGFAVQLALLRHPGTVLANLDQSPEPLVIWLASHLGLPAAAFAAYARRPQTMTDLRAGSP
jgi:hypothetical protein